MHIKLPFVAFLAAAAFCASSAIAQVPQLPTPQPKAAIPTATPAPTPPPPTLAASSWVLMDYATGQVLLEGNADQRVEPASITKIMTSYVVSAELEHGKIHLDDPVSISENAWRSGGAGTDGSTSFLALDSQVPLKELLYGMIIQSGNDAAIALAEHTAGSESLFADLMNQYAAQLGMKGTHYMDASGLPNDNHYTTALDVALLSRALIRDYPKEYAIYKIKDFEWNGIKQHNRNTLLWRDSSVDGIKTGHTSNAGYCLATSAQRGDQRLIAVVMGAASEKARADANQELLNYGFRFFETHKLYEVGKPLATPELWKGETDTVGLGVAEDVLVTLPRGRYADLKASMDLPSKLIAPLEQGQEVGKLKIELDGKMILERPIVVMANTPEGGFFKRLTDGVMLWFSSEDEAGTTPADPGLTMKNLDDIKPDNPEQGFQFPGEFEITALGRVDADLEVRIPELLQGLGLAVLAGSLRSKPSREGNYVSVSVTFNCPDREAYDAAHATLRAQPGIRWTL